MFMNYGNNLISYIGEDEKPTLDALPDYIKAITTFIIGQKLDYFTLILTMMVYMIVGPVI